MIPINPRLFEWYARRIWPVHRLLVRGLTARCRRCIISAKCAPLGANGLCDACRSYTTAAAAVVDTAGMATRFHALLQEHAGAGPRYDAALLLSGGKDSAYILYRLRQEHPGLRLLCITIDNGFMAPVALRNCQRTAARLGVDLLVDGSHHARFAQVLRQAFLDLRGRGAYGVVDFADGATIFELGRQAARDLGIPLLIGGLSWVQLEHIVGIIDGFEQPQDALPRLIFPLAVWRVDEQEIRAEVRRRDLLVPGFDSPLATNSDLIMPMSVVDMLTQGYCSFEPEFSQLVREGKTDAKLWRNLFELLELGVRSGRLVRDADAVLKRLDLCIADIVTASAAAGRTP